MVGQCNSVEQPESVTFTVTGNTTNSFDEDTACIRFPFFSCRFLRRSKPSTQNRPNVFRRLWKRFRQTVSCIGNVDIANSVIEDTDQQELENGALTNGTENVNDHNYGLESKQHQEESTCNAGPSTSSLERHSSSLERHPLTPGQAIACYKDMLTSFEHLEIFNYTEIFFVGQNADKHQHKFNDPDNRGFDDKRGFYLHIPNDHIAYRYEFLTAIGRGGFGQVAKVYDHKLQQHVALKMVRNNETACHLGAREIQILEVLRKQDEDNKMNVIHILDHFTFRNHVCMTFELLYMSLQDQIDKTEQGFSLPLVCDFTYSTLNCLNGLHKSKIMHCDLKPENIILKQPSRSEINVIDFGFSRYDGEDVEPWIQTLYYRAPEVILGADCGMAMDMWSLGCTMAELFTGVPLFYSEDEYDQLACIIELLGMPPQRLMDSSKRVNHFFNKKGYPKYCNITCSQDGSVKLSGSYSFPGKFRGPPGSREWGVALNGCDDPLFLKFLKGCLEWDPNLRMTPEQALRHPWLLNQLPGFYDVISIPAYIFDEEELSEPTSCKSCSLRSVLFDVSEELSVDNIYDVCYVPSSTSCTESSEGCYIPSTASSKSEAEITMPTRCKSCPF
ncbi:dual specificity tyrosine-phosphorylation-regulated kinase 2-like [Bombina bombina]|uniref:dual specificity tyrosine-phosphorylation-regulated kinase 2-like n=1 Tax=Bombina bombina TaxID=8345 RepID=UPI00235ACBC0|nr:dual specificity tyrosine-phosphorylation-regulated kinase 2-like [Bombina bombina]